MSSSINSISSTFTLQDKNNKQEKEKTKEKQDVLDALNLFYSMKSQYETNLNKEKTKIINNKDLSNREKQREFKKLKPKCINCKRPVGTIFATIYDEKEDGRQNKAQCGDRTNPCDLNIVINLGKIIRLEDFLEMDEKDISKLKVDIIKDKNDLIFGYITTEEALDKFEKSKENLNELVSSYELSLEKFMMVINNKEKKEELRKIEKEIKSNISYIKDALKKDTTQKSVNDIIAFQINEMMPKVEQRQELLYPYNAVETINNNCYLNQKKVTIEQLENNYSVNNVKVLDMTVGVRKKVEQKPQDIEDYLEMRT